MLARLRHYLSADYLLSQGPYAQVPPFWGHLLWGLVLVLAVCLAARNARRATQTARRWGWGATALSSGAALLALVWQLLGDGPLSARVWAVWLSGLTLYLLITALWSRSLSIGRYYGILRALARALGLSVWLAVVPGGRTYVVLAVLALLAATMSSTGRRVHWEILTPLRLAYASVISRLALVALGVDLDAYAGASFPNPLSAWLHPTAAAVASVGWCWVKAASVSKGRGRSVMIALMSISLLGWGVAVAWRHLSHGATGSDPYTYLQMALDLLNTRTALHRFELATLATELRIATWPTVPVGYNAPAGGHAASVWPTGWSLALAGAFRLGGEPLAMWLAPLCHLATAVVSGLLGAEIHRGQGSRVQWAIGGLTATLVLTSYEGMTRTLVPMADAAASLCGVAMFLALLRAVRSNRLGLNLIAGLLWGATYAVRHPQVWLGLGGILLLVTFERPWPRRLASLAFYCLGAAALALPDLAYHRNTFGSPWLPESSEWLLLALGNIPQMWGALWRDGWWRQNEWGYLWPWLAVGLVEGLRQRAHRKTWLALTVGYGSCLLFHLSYCALRMRDLTPLFPWMALLVSWGAWRLTRAVSEHGPRQLRSVLAALLALSLAARSAQTLQLATQPNVWTFGYVTAAERVGLESLSTLTPTNAVIGTGLNAGAVHLYAQRATVRPAVWSETEFATMAEALAARNRPLYVLDDGEEMASWLASYDGQIEAIAWVNIPRMGRGGQHQGASGMLYRLQH